jgi:hypothetical protein
MSDHRYDAYREEFGRQLSAASRSRAAGGLARRLRLLVLSALPLGAVTAVALAASGALTGEPVTSRYGAAVSAEEGTGTAVPASAILSDLRVADPAGGLPWGLRIVRTTRDAGCVQVGRVLAGQLGVLGQNGAFSDDGLFHPLGPEVLDDAACQPLDDAGQLFVAMSYQGLPASAYGSGCAVGVLPERFRRPNAVQLPQCPTADLRILYYGTLGPRAESVTYPDDDGRPATALTSGTAGAYLVVLPVGPHHRPRGGFVPSTSPLSGLRSVQYRDGHVCHIPNPRRLGGARPCPRYGYVAPPRVRLDRRTLPVPIDVTFGPTPQVPEDMAPEGPQPKLWIGTVRFRAPADSPGFHAYYIVEREFDRYGGARCGGVMINAVRHTVRAGELVSSTMLIDPSCHGTGRGTVYFHQPAVSGRYADQFPYGGLGTDRDPVVGRFRFTVPE